MGGDTFETPPPTDNFCFYPPSVLRCFRNDPLMNPHHDHPPHFKHLSLLPPPNPPSLPPTIKILIIQNESPSCFHVIYVFQIFYMSFDFFPTFKGRCGVIIHGYSFYLDTGITFLFKHGDSHIGLDWLSIAVPIFPTADAFRDSDQIYERVHIFYTFLFLSQNQ